MTNTHKQDQKSPKEAQKIVEIISLDIDEEGEVPLELSAETTLELLEDAQEENYEAELARYTDDAEIEADFEERQRLNAGANELAERLTAYHATSPTLSGGDVDAAWQDANVGEETAGGMAPTPDQDDVEEIGKAYGIQYADEEPLHTGEKLAERDENRWELNPDSAGYTVK
ncbi:MAG: hypothetical protein KC445_08100 [Anaerolineales bacterium]|nr:hypothetical protein [Anaerolineales bacterium]